MGTEPDKRETIRTLYDLYRHDIYRFARYTLGDEASAYDVVQEVFIRAIRSWDRFRQEANAKTWLLSIARNYMYDSIRKRKKWEQFAARYDPPPQPDFVQSVEDSLILEQALATLKDTYRQVLVLRHIEHLSVAESAGVLGWSEGKVRTTDYRAMATLRAILGADRGEVNL